MQTVKTRTPVLLGVILAGAVGFATAAQADLPKAGIPHAFLPKARVSYADLDVTSPQDQAKLARRISRAADAVCDSDEYDAAGAAACRDKVTSKAVADLEAQGVTLR